MGFEELAVEVDFIGIDVVSHQCLIRVGGDKSRGMFCVEKGLYGNGLVYHLLVIIQDVAEELCSTVVVQHELLVVGLQLLDLVDTRGCVLDAQVPGLQSLQVYLLWPDAHLLLLSYRSRRVRHEIGVVGGTVGLLEHETVSAYLARDVDVDAPVGELAQGIQGSQVVAF